MPGLSLGLRLGLNKGAKAAAWTPLDLGGSLYDMWDAERAAQLTLSGAAVTAWASAKNGYSAAQGVGASRPAYSATSFNGRPGVTFDGSDDELTFAGVGVFPTGATPSEIWALVDQTALPADTSNRMTASYGAGSTLRRALSRTVVTGVNRGRADAGNGTVSVTATDSLVDLSGRHVLRGVVTATDVSAAIDGATATTAAAVPATDVTRVRLGANSSTTAANFFQGVISLIAVTAILNTAQAAQMMAYLKARGGIA